MKKITVAVSLSLVLVCTSINNILAKANKPLNSYDKKQAVSRLEKISGGRIKLRDKDGRVFLAGKLSEKQIAGKKSAVVFLQSNRSILGLEDPASSLKATDTEKDQGATWVKFVQVIDGYSIEGTSINVHFDKNGYIRSVNGHLEQNEKLETFGENKISKEDAAAIAKKQYIYDSLRCEPKINEVIINKDNRNYQVYKVNISFLSPCVANYDVYIDVYSGKIVKTEDNLRTDGPTTGSGMDVTGAERKLNLYQSSNKYKMKDISRNGTEGIFTYNLNHKTSGGTVVACTKNVFNSEYYKAAVSAHYNAGAVIDFYKNLFDRDSLDDEGMSITSYVHYKKKFNNALWDGYEMIYGDGDGQKFTYLSGDLGIVGHEMTHGLISNTADLQYHNESGALNESIADVFGVLIATYDKYKVASGGKWEFNDKDWIIGQNVYTPKVPGDALRSLADPALYGQPDNMKDYENYDDVENEDWGGVHVNSGIPSKAAYLIAKSIGMEETARIYYKALNEYMTPLTDFEDARSCIEEAAVDLYGDDSKEVSAVSSAFDLVGI